MSCFCVDKGKNPAGFEKLEDLLGRNAISALLILPLAGQNDETPFLHLDGTMVSEDECGERARLFLQDFRRSWESLELEEARCRYYECIESYLENEILSWSRDTNRDYWLVVEERRPGRLPLGHIQFHCRPPDIGWFSQALEVVESQLEQRLKEVKPQ